MVGHHVKLIAALAGLARVWLILDLFNPSFWLDLWTSTPFCADLEIVAVLENVQSMPAQVLDQYNKWMKSRPIALNAASCGWTQRNRLFWLCNRRRGLEANLTPPSPCHCLQLWLHRVSSRCCSRSHLQCSLTTDSAHCTPLPETLVTRLIVFIMCHHWQPLALRRTIVDSLHRPMRITVWCGSMHGTWRQPTPVERAQILDVPPAAVDAVPVDHRRQGRNSGSTYRRCWQFSVSCPCFWRPSCCPNHNSLTLNSVPGLDGTVWAPCPSGHIFLASCQAKMPARRWVAALAPLTSLWALMDQCMSGLSRQRYAPDSSRGLVALQPLFQALKVHRSHSANMVAQDKTGKNPAFVACMTALLRWPDFKQPLHPPGPPGLSHCLARPTVWSFPPHASPTRLLASRPPRFVDRHLRGHTGRDAQRLLRPSPLELDREFGSGDWRFLERFLIVQQDGKKGVIDNGRKSGHNRGDSFSWLCGSGSTQCFVTNFKYLLTSGPQHTFGSPFDWGLMTFFMVLLTA